MRMSIRAARTVAALALTLTLPNLPWVVDSSAAESLTTMGATLPAARSFQAAAVDDRVLYVFGGVNSAGYPVRDVVRYDSNTATVSTFTNVLPSDGRYCASAVWDPAADVAYIFGGRGWDGSGYTISNQILRYDPGTNTVSHVANLKSARACTAAVWNPLTGRAYIFGGEDLGGTELNEILEFIPGQSPANSVATLFNNLAISDMAAVWDSGRSKAWLFGGELGSGGDTGLIQEWQPGLGQASRITNSLPTPRRFTSAVYDTANLADPRVYVFGGLSGGSTYYSDILRFKINTLSVEDTGWDLPAARAMTAAGWNGGRAFIFGGEQGATRYSSILRYNPGASDSPLADFDFSNVLNPTTNPNVYTFDASKSKDFDGITSYAWLWGHTDTQPTSGRILAHTFPCLTDPADPSSTSYSVRLTVTDADGFMASVTKTVDVARTDGDSDRLARCAELAVGQATSDADVDTDNDGIDDFEESTHWPGRNAAFTRASVYCNTNVNPNVCEYPNPTTRDLYVELDWMDGHALEASNRTTVVNNFANAPINTDASATNNLIFHLDTGNLGRGGTVLALAPSSTEANIRAYKTDPNNFNPNRLDIFRYGVIACTDSDHPTRVGWGDWPGRTFALFDCLADMDLPDAHAKEFMHELGHNILGLQVDDTACAGRPFYLTRRNPDLDHFTVGVANCDGAGGFDVHGHPVNRMDVMNEGGPRGKDVTTYAGNSWADIKLDFGIDGTVAGADCASTHAEEGFIGQLSGLCDPGQLPNIDVCPPPQVGLQPDCFDTPCLSTPCTVDVCQNDGEVGVEPFCIVVPCSDRECTIIEPCGEGEVGTPPFCESVPCDLDCSVTPCDKNQLGVFEPFCFDTEPVEECPSGQIGVPPVCLNLAATPGTEEIGIQPTSWIDDVIAAVDSLTAAGDRPVGS